MFGAPSGAREAQRCCLRCRRARRGAISHSSIASHTVSGPGAYCASRRCRHDHPGPGGEWARRGIAVMAGPRLIARPTSTRLVAQRGGQKQSKPSTTAAVAARTGRCLPGLAGPAPRRDRQLVTVDDGHRCRGRLRWINAAGVGWKQTTGSDERARTAFRSEDRRVRGHRPGPFCGIAVGTRADWCASTKGGGGEPSNHARAAVRGPRPDEPGRSRDLPKLIRGPTEQARAFGRAPGRPGTRPDVASPNEVGLRRMTGLGTERTLANAAATT